MCNSSLYEMPTFYGIQLRNIFLKFADHSQEKLTSTVLLVQWLAILTVQPEIASSSPTQDI